MTIDDATRAYILHLQRTPRAPNTVNGRIGLMRRLEQHFGASTDLASLQPADLLAWIAPLKPATAAQYLSGVSQLYRHAGLDDVARVARDQIQAEGDRTAAHRAATHSNAADPLRPDEMAAVLNWIDSERPDWLILFALLYETGLRYSESRGLQWGDVWWGRDGSDTSRHLRVERQVQAGGRVRHLTKSGPPRSVTISRRLRGLLRKEWLRQGQPEGGTSIVTPRSESGAGKVLRAATGEPRSIKDLRDTYASVLLTAGIPLKWISLQLGHGSVAVTERHYARWIGDGYQSPWTVPDGCTPPDCFAAYDGWGQPARMRGTA